MPPKRRGKTTGSGGTTERGHLDGRRHGQSDRGRPCRQHLGAAVTRMPTPHRAAIKSAPPTRNACYKLAIRNLLSHCATFSPRGCRRRRSHHTCHGVKIRHRRRRRRVVVVVTVGHRRSPTIRTRDPPSCAPARETARARHCCSRPRYCLWVTPYLFAHTARCRVAQT